MYRREERKTPRLPLHSQGYWGTPPPPPATWEDPDRVSVEVGWLGLSAPLWLKYDM